MARSVTVRVPATTANIGPGFDCLGVALDLWNETTFSLENDRLIIEIQGEGKEQLPTGQDNLIYQTVCRVYAVVGQNVPAGLRIACENHVPLSSGLGSSSAATLTGVLGANALLGFPLGRDAIIGLCTQIEGHPDNVAPAYLGGLAVSLQDGGVVITRTIPIPEWGLLVILPDVKLSTQESREALPPAVPMADAVFNIGHAALAIEALRSGDVALLQAALKDRLHQPYRLPLIPGAVEALHALQELGIPAALSGAGPGLIAFSPDPHQVSETLQKIFQEKDIESRVFHLSTTSSGAVVTTSEGR